MSANLIVWGTIIQWLTIAILLAYDSTRVYLRARRQYRTALSVGNGRVLVARKRNEISRWYIVASYIAVALGLLSTYSNVFLSPPPPDIRMVGIFIREGIVLMLFAVWRTNRGNVALYKESDARRESLAAQTRRIESVATDTNVRVREMQERGQSDQPEEQTDRSEGRQHRTDIERDLSADREERAEERQLDREERARERRDDREERRDERSP